MDLYGFREFLLSAYGNKEYSTLSGSIYHRVTIYHIVFADASDNFYHLLNSWLSSRKANILSTSLRYTVLHPTVTLPSGTKSLWHPHVLRWRIPALRTKALWHPYVAWWGISALRTLSD